MNESIFDPKLLYLAMQKAGVAQGAKSSFVDAGTMASGGAGGQAPPPGGGGQPGGQPGADPSAGGGQPPAPPAPAAGGGAPPPDPMSQTLDPAAAGPGQSMESRMAALEAGGGAGKPKGGANEKAEQAMMMKQMVNMMSILFTHLNIPVPPQVMIPESASGIPAGSPQVQQVGQDASAAQQGADQQQGPSSVLGDVGGPPQPVSAMTPILGGGQGGGAPGGDPGKSAALLKRAGFEGIAVTPETLRNIASDNRPMNGSNGSHKKSGPGASRILGLR